MVQDYYTDEVHWRQARDLIVRAKPYWATFNVSSYIKELTIGNIWLAHGNSSDMSQAAQDAKKACRPFIINYSVSKEGAVLSLDSMVLHKSGPDPTPPTASSTSCSTARIPPSSPT